ncbi:WbqC family protein [Herbaspirillum sp. NPDC087042]|uniref:WbqC family protein n=1 Tax=Herbaspirillum sp. NPDC087042 TaxID=3364004 RepID=UPI003824FC97
MKIAVMQPYFLPYFGYFQLIEAADLFVIYDNIEYTKKGWINRNRFLRNSADAMFSLPLTQASDYLDVRERRIAPDFNKAKFLNQFREAYRKAPFFDQGSALLEEIMASDESNLFGFIHHSVKAVCACLGIATPIVVSSTLEIAPGLKGQDKVIAYCRAADADAYINPMGGIDLYDKTTFAAHGLKLEFLRPHPLQYQQFGGNFVPSLSIIDALMFNGAESIKQHLNREYDLI